MINHSTRAHSLLSASSAHRWLACPPSAVAAEAYPSQDTEYTREGTLAHEVAEIVAKRPEARNTDARDWPQDGVTQEMVDCAARYADYIQEQITSDSATVLLEQRVDFSRWVPNGFGTCDCIILQGDTMTIIDYKYGQGVPVSAVGNPQMMLYALGAWSDYGFAYDIETVEMHIFQPRIGNISKDKLPLQDLLTWAGMVVTPTAALAAKGEGEYKPGEHCRFCPHAGRCRALTEVCTTYVETHDLRVAVPVLAPHEVADVLAMEPLVNLWLKKVKAQALTTLMEGGEIPGYKVVEGKLGNRKWTDELKTLEALMKAGYDQKDVTETKLLSPAGMDKAIGKKKVVELLDSFIDRSPGAPTIVPETDKRPPLDRVAEAQKDFE